MKNIIIGTAGHIDHGKTTLIKALTGRNTDRWAEEQRRGITIDLGFTYFDLPSGDRVGIIDVPGHEKFINNMVAGVVGMDLVLLVIAADEGIMPQTREHMDILHLLGIQKSIVVLTKCDLVDEDWLALMEEDVKEELSGTFLEDSPIVRISAVSGEGLDQLIDTISQMTSTEVVPKDIHTIPRLPIDRSFSLSGFGTIITGTLVSGTMNKEELLEVYPLGKECRIRSIQVHGEDKQECFAGQRVAINLSNVKKTEVKRGCVLAPVNSMKNTDLLDVKLEMLKSSSRILKNHERLHFFTGTSEILCRAVLLDQQELQSGESGYVQLRLEEEVAVRRGDKFVVRFYSPMETIGGGEILEPNPGIKKRFDESSIEELQQKESGSSADVIQLHIRQHGDTLITATELAKLTALTVEEVQQDVAQLEEQGLVTVFPMKKDTFIWHRDSIYESLQKMKQILDAYEEKYPYRFGMKKAEMQTTAFQKIKPAVFDKIVDWMVGRGELNRVEEFLCTPEFEVRKDAMFQQIAQKLLETFTKAKYDFVRFSEIPCSKEEKGYQDDVVNILREEGQVTKLGEDLFTLTAYTDHARETIVNCLKENPVITIAQVRDLFETSRKSAKILIEYLDSIKVTKKTGGESERVAY